MSSPFDLQTIASLVRSAIAPQSPSRSSATNPLHEYEKQPGFLSALLQLFLEPNIDEQTKYLSIVLAKNVAKRIWKAKNPTQQVIDQERDTFKASLLSILPAMFSVNSIQTNNMEFILLFRNVSRHEFPGDWPELVSQFPSAFESLNSFDSIN